MSKGICRIVSIALIVLMLTTVGPLEGLAVTMQPKNIPAEMSNTAEPLRVDAADENGQDNVEDDVSSAQDEEQVASSGERTFALQEELQQSLDHMQDRYAAYLARKTKSNSAAPGKAPKKAGENDSITYRFDDATKTLTFTGTGALDDYGDTENLFNYDSSFDMSTMPPWYEHAAETETVVVGEGITALGNCSFMLFSQLKTVQLPTTLTRIGDYSFAFTDALETITLPSGLTDLGYGAFVASGLQEIDVPAGVSELNFTFSYCWNLNHLILHEGLQSMNGALGEAILPELTVPSTVSNADSNNLIGLHVLYNYSKEASFIQDVYPLSSSPVTEDAARGYNKLMVQTTKPGFNWEEFDEYEVIQELIDWLNEKYGTDYTIDDFESLFESNPSDAEITVYCYDDSQEHNQVKNLGYKHYIIQEDGTLSDSLCPDYGTGTAGDNITWHMDFETHTLIFEGHGQMTVQPYRESDYPWTGLAGEVETVRFVGDEEGQIENLVSRAFYQFKNLKTVSLPDGMTEIGGYAFSECTALQRVEIGSALASLYNSAFSECSSLTEIVISEDNPIFYLQDGCLYQHCGNADTLHFCMSTVSQLVLPDTVTKIESGAFSVAAFLERLSLNKAIDNMDSYTFEGLLGNCSSLTEITLDESTEHYCLVDDALYNKALTILYFCPRNKESVEIPEGVKTIGSSAFKNCKQLTEIILPTSVSSLSYYCFENCVSLEQLTIMNPECYLNYYSGIPTQTVIYGYPGSSAASYAGEHGNVFVAIEGLVSVALKSLPKKTTYYTFEDFERDGIILSATYENGTTADITTGFKISGFQKGQVGTQTMTINYQGYTLTFDVEVQEVPQILAGTHETIASLSGRMVWRFVPTFDGDFTITTSGYISVYDTIPNYWWGSSLASGSGVTFAAEAGKTYYLALSRDWIGTGEAENVTLFLRHNHVFDDALSENCTICGERIEALMQGSCGEQLNYTLYDEGTLVLTGSGEMTGHPWSDNMSDIKRIVLPVGLTGIADHAFDACNQLQEIAIPIGVEKIGQYAFSHCQNLKNVTLPNSLTTIEKYAFYDCNSLTEITIPNGVALVNAEAWYSCDALELIHVSEANQTYSSMDGVLFNKDQTALILCPPKKVSITLPDTLKTINSYSFRDCNALREVTIPDGVETIEQYAFNYCQNLERIALPNNLKSIAGYAIYGCNSLEVIIIPEGVASISSNAWIYCNALEAILVSEGNQAYSSVDGVLYNKDQSTLIFCPPKKESITLPGTLKTINSYAFRDCNALREVTIPDGVETIEQDAFYSCWNLARVTLPGTLKSIGDYAFYSCRELESVTLPNRLERVGNYAFYYCNTLKDIIIPSSVGSIGYSAFYRCDQLESILINSPQCSIGTSSDTFPTQATIYGYPASTAQDYANRYNRTFVSIDVESVTIKTLPDKMEYQAWDTLDTTGLTLAVTYSDGNAADIATGFTVSGFEKGAVGTQTITVSYFDHTASFDVTVFDYPTLKVGESHTKTYDNYETFYWRFQPEYSGRFVLTTDKALRNGSLAVFDVDPTVGGHTAIASYNAYWNTTAPLSVPFDAEKDTTYYLRFSGGYDVSTFGDLTISLKHQHVPAEPFSGLCGLCGEPLETITEGSCGKQLQYALYQEGTLLISGTGVMTSHPWTSMTSQVKKVILQDGVTSICASAFSNCSELVSIEIPDTVASIGNSAFGYCKKLEAVQLPAGLASLDSSAFINCTALTSVSFAEEKPMHVFEFNGHYYALYASSVTWDEAVMRCEDQGGHLATITSAEENAVIASAVRDSGMRGVMLGGTDKAQEGTWAWMTGEEWNYTNWSGNEPNNQGWTDSKNADILWIYSDSGKWDDTNDDDFPAFICEWDAADEIPVPYIVCEPSFALCSNGAITIGTSAFSGCTSLKNVALSEHISTIGSNAFSNCTALTTIVIPAGLETIDSAAFSGCTSLESVTLSETVARIGYSAFLSCSALKEITIPAEVDKIGDQAFAVSGLETITFAGGTELDGSKVFYRSALNEAVLLDGVDTFNAFAWGACNDLISFTVSEGNPNFSSVDGVLYNKEQTKLICCPKSRTTLELSDTVTEIENYALLSCNQLTNIIMSTDLTRIGNYAFADCTSLQTITIPESVNNIGTGAFSGCESLERVVIPSGVSSISGETFESCQSLKGIVIPDSVTKIGRSAFYECSALETIHIPETVATIDEYAFYGCSALASVSVDTTETATLLGPKIEAEETHIVSGDPNWKKSADLASGGRCLDKGKDFDFMLFVNQDGTYTLSERACYNNRSFNLYVDGEMVGTYYPDLITSGNNDRYYTDFEIAAIPLIAGIHTIRITASSNPPIFDYFTITSEAEGETAFAKTAYTGLAQIDTNAFASCGALSSVRFTGTISNWRNISIANGNDAFINAVQDHSHVFGDAAVIDAVSCTQKGTSHYVCDTCGFEVRFEVEKLQHEYELTEHAATDGHEAYKEYVCKNCGDTYTELYPASAVEGFTGVADANKISLSWLKAVEASVSGYEIFRKAETEESFTLLKTISSRNTLAYTDGNLDDGIYRYKIRAMKGSIAGTFTDEIAVSTIPDTQAPRVLSAGPKAKTVQNGTITLTASAEDNVAVTKLVVSASSDHETWNELYTSTSNKLQYRFDTSAYADGTVYLKYVAYDKAGNQSEDYLMEYTLDNTGPQKVMNIKLVQVFASSATLSWDADSEGETYSYTVERFDSAKETFVPYKKGVKTTGINLSGLLPETDYKFRVAGVDAYGNLGEWSEVFSFSTPADTTAPVITRQSPASCSVKDKVTYTVTATDDTALDSIAFRISQNHAEWITVAEKTASGTAASVSYTFDLSAYAEGIVEVSAVAKDSSGNTSSTTNAPYTEYRIDRTAPQMPAAPTAVGRDGYIDISWNAADDGDTSAFRLYRSTEKNGTYEIIKQGSLISFSDTAVQPGTMYWYKLRAVDAAGNVSGFSDAVSAAPTEDVTPPAIADLILSADKRVVTVKGTDNHFTDSITVEYSLNQKDFTPVSMTYNTRGATTLATAALPVFDNGKNVTVRAKAFDAAGNESDWTSVTFTADTAAPTLHDLQAALNDGAMTISWKDGAEEDLAGFEIYYSVNGGTYKLFISRAASASHEYTVTKSLKSFTNGSYRFRVDAIDTSQNRKSYETDTFEHTQGIDGITTGDGEEINKLNAVITVPAYLETEVGELFDASASTSASEIVSYAWTFGDGTTAKGKTVEKRYEQQGAYTVALTITDALGNTNTAETTVTVLPRAKYGFASIKVTDENGKALRGATVCMNFGEEDQFSQMTDANGKVTMRVVEGTHTIAASNGADYLPASGSVKIVAGETTTATLTLENGTIMTSDLTVKKMTLDEIIAAGISVSDPANNSYYSGEITIFYREKIIHYTYVRTDTKIVGYTVDVPGGPQPVYIPNDGGIELIAFIFIPIKAGFLKDFYQVNFTVCNNASVEFAIDDLVATVAVPNGMTLMRGLNGFEETATVKLGTITGQSSKNVMWCLRADRAGSYDINVSADGTLRGFDTPLYTSQSSTVTVARMSERMQVIAEFPEGIYVQMKKWRKRIYRMEDPSLYIAAEKFDATAYFNVGFENIDDEDLYCPTLDVDAVRLLFKTDNLKDKLDIEETGTYVVGADGTRTEVTGEDVQILHAGEKYLKYFKITFSEDSTNDAFDVFMNRIQNFRTYYHRMESSIFLSHSSDPDMQLDVTLDSAFFDQLYYGREIPVYEERFSEDPYLVVSMKKKTSFGDYHQLAIGESNQMEAELRPDNEFLTEGLTWSSSDTDVLPIDNDGFVQGVTKGYSYVSASVIEDNYETKYPKYVIVDNEKHEWQYSEEEGICRIRSSVEDDHVTPKDIEVTYVYSDDYFKEISTNNYNHDLAKMSLRLALSAFNSAEGGYSIEKSKNVRELLANCKFKDISASDSYGVKPSANSIAVCLGNKDIDGVKLIAIAIRGGGYESEWAGNFYINSEGTKHPGFELAAKKVETEVIKYINAHDELQNCPLKFWVVGYSRGGATANLVSAWLGENHHSLDYSNDDIYSYTFEAPQPEKYANCGGYDFIHNIVNPVDFVPKVVMSDWNYFRYGRDYWLPNASTTSLFNTPDYVKEISDSYNAYRRLGGATKDESIPLHSSQGYIFEKTCDALARYLEEPTSEKSVVVSYLVQQSFLRKYGNNADLPEDVFYRFLAAVAIEAFAPSVIKLVTTHYLPEIPVSELARKLIVLISNIVSKTVLHGVSRPDLLNGLGSALAELFVDIMEDFDETEYMVANILNLHYMGVGTTELEIQLGYKLYSCFSKLMTAHHPELTLALIDSVDTLPDRTGYRVTSTKCPVDIIVYDKDNNIVSKIINDRVVETDSIVSYAYVDEQGGKIVVLPNDSNYTIRVIARDDGTVNYNVKEIDGASGTIAQLVDYANVEIKDGDLLIATIPEVIDETITEYEFRFNGRDDELSRTVLSCDEIQQYQITTTFNVGGTTLGDSLKYFGDFVTVEAYPDEGYQFDGWYENGVLISREAAYQFKVKADVTLFAKFVKHEHDYVQTAAVSATCAEPGSVTYTCSVCGESYVETLPIVDHKDDNDDGKCDFCEEKMTGGGRCKYCGKIHKGFGGFFTKIIHAILYFFAHLFRRM